MALLYYISYLAILATFAFVTLSLASGLLYISELIEEHGRISKIWGQRGIYAIIVVHILLYFFDSLPPSYIAFSIFCHAVYLQNFSNAWPLISLSSLSFIASCVLVIADHFLWFFHFSKMTQEARGQRYYRGPRIPGFAEIATFFGICVWMAPLFLFLSLSANDNALPTSDGTVPTSPSKQFAPQRTSLFRSIMSVFSFASPRLRAKIRKETAEGIIAPSSPGIAPASPYSSSHAVYSTRTPPRSPRSPRFQNGDSKPAPHLSPNFQLGTPPRRTAETFRIDGSSSRSGSPREELRRVKSTQLGGNLSRRM